MKFAAFILGLFAGSIATYFFLTRLWWPDVRFPGVVLTAAAPALPSPTPVPAVPEILMVAPAAERGPTPAFPLPSSSPAQMNGEVAPPPETLAATEPPLLSTDLAILQARHLVLPVAGIAAGTLHDSFADDRGGRLHDAIDIMAPRGAPVLAVDDGRVAKLFTSRFGGLTIYQFDEKGVYCYYYAHLDAYAPGLMEGAAVKKGEVIGRVGTTGNAPPGTPHLHFTIFRLGVEKRWWQGTAVNAYPLWGPPSPP